MSFRGANVTEVFDRAVDALVMRSHKVGSAGAEGATADPYLLGAPLSGRLWMAGAHQRGVYGENRVRAYLIRQFDGSFHRFVIADDHGCVAAAGVA